MEIYAVLAVAIAAEVVATTALARSASFTKLVPSLVAIGGYAVAFWLLSLALQVIPTGIVYAIWSGLGIVLIAAVAWLRYGQALDGPALFGMGLILAGVLVVNLFSKSVGH
nr:SMR family transporter [Rubellimicrobium roseum]